jgi:ABC-type sugar transport system permease subunit
MSDTLISQGAELEAKPVPRSQVGFFSGRRGRHMKESLLAYALLLPAFVIVFVFGLFPLAFSAYQSTLQGLNRILGRYGGLQNYVRAIDNLTYVLGFWLAILLFVLAVRTLINTSRKAREHGERPWIWALPGAVMGSALALWARFIFVLLPAMLAIPDQMRNQERTGELFRQLLGETLQLGGIRSSFRLALVVFLASFVVLFVVYRYAKHRRHGSQYYSGFVQITVFLLSAAGLGWLTWLEIQKVTAEALESGATLELWPQVIMISTGIGTLLLSWLLWRSASGRDSTAGMALRLAGAAMLMVGGWVLIGELPRVIAAGDASWWNGLQATVYYSLGTIPVQLLVSLLLATLLFQNIRGKTFFRIVYFLPYIAPFVGTAAAFRILFSGRANAPVNSLLSTFGVAPLRWLNEPTGILQLILGQNATLPDWAVGPSLALIVIMIFGTWTFFGFNTVVFLAGLGSIPSELYEAAAIDGAGRWAQFRNVTLPLLSPTIYFLTLWATIGTFKAFNHIYVLRAAAALGTTDTVSVVIFQQFKRDTRFGYASALAILLLLIILILTYVNNRIASRRVFYG